MRLRAGDVGEYVGEVAAQLWSQKGRAAGLGLIRACGMEHALARIKAVVRRIFSQDVRRPRANSFLAAGPAMYLVRLSRDAVR